jgi:integrase/recombinase XerD
MSTLFYSRPSVIKRLCAGSLGCQMEVFGAWLSDQGYARYTIRHKLRMVSHLSHWLQRRGLGIEDVNERRVAEFLCSWGRSHVIYARERASFSTLLAWLRQKSLIAPTVIEHNESPFRFIEKDYIRYLTQERGLAAATVKNYVPTARLFLSGRFKANSMDIRRLQPQDVTKFICSRTDSPRRIQLVVTALRSFLRFLWLRGEISTDLAACVPAVANRPLSELRKYLEPEEVERLLQNCDQHRPVGRRDYAMLLLMARLGLRAGEILTLTLDDIDWDAGVLTIGGKGRRQDQLPISREVGIALAQYLRDGRPPCSTRRLFVRARAPFRGLARNGSVCAVVRYACRRAGLSPAHQGAHLLRHSLATNMLRHGASLREIGELLRHRLPQTTEIYAKVDLEGLRTVTQPWIGGEL